MKKVLISMLAIIMCIVSVSMLTACGNKKYAGTYEMISISGQMTSGGQTTQITKDLYDYYRIVLEEDGTAIVQSKGAGNTTAIEVEGTWEFSDGKILLRSVNSGITTVEEMEWNDGVICYSCNDYVQGYSVQMEIVLQRK